MKRLAFVLLAFVLLACGTPAESIAPMLDLECARAGVDAQACERGRDVFFRDFTPETGLGAQNNGSSCVQCHALPVVGGQGSYADRVYASAKRYDGAKARSFPPAQPFHLPSALWTAAEIEAVTEQEILDGCGVDEELAIHGEASRKELGIGRFGRGAQAISAHAFNVGAFRHELGGCAPHDPSENPLCYPGQQPMVTAAETADLTAYVLGLAAPEPVPLDTQERTQGEAVFAIVGCAVCHSPTRSMRSDLCLHDLGRENADDESTWWRTAPLEGVRHMATFGHDGRAASVEDAIELVHAGGEGRAMVRRWRSLSARNREALLRFVEAL